MAEGSEAILAELRTMVIRLQKDMDEIKGGFATKEQVARVQDNLLYIDKQLAKKAEATVADDVKKLQENQRWIVITVILSVLGFLGWILREILVVQVTT